MLLDPSRILVLGVLLAGGAFWIVLAVRAKAKRDASTRAMAAGLLCPGCGSRTLEWPGAEWRVHILYANGREEEKTGPLFRCGTCGQDFTFNERGEFQSEDGLGPTLKPD